MYVLIDEKILNELRKNQHKIIDLFNSKLTNISKNEGRTKNFSFMTVRESTRYLNTSEIFLRKLIESKELKVKRIGKAIRISIDDLESIIT